MSFHAGLSLCGAKRLTAFGIEAGELIAVVQTAMLCGACYMTLQHVVSGGEHGSGDGEDRLLGSSARAQTMELSLQVGGEPRRRKTSHSWRLARRSLPRQVSSHVVIIGSPDGQGPLHGQVGVRFRVGR
jgi:hypothetical protein